MNVKTIGLPFTTVNCCSDTTANFIPVTGWMSPAEMQKCKATLEIRARCGAAEVAVGYQLADVENAPDAGNEILSYTGPAAFRSSAGVHYPDLWDTAIEADSAGKQLIRFGFMMTSTSPGTDVRSARVAAKIQVYTC